MFTRAGVALSLAIALSGCADRSSVAPGSIGAQPNHRAAAASKTRVGHGFDKPYAVAADAHGNVFVADTYHDAIKKVSADGHVSTIFDQCYEPKGVAVDPAGNVYASCDPFIEKIAPNGATTSMHVPHCLGLAADEIGNIYAACRLHVFEINANGIRSLRLPHFRASFNYVAVNSREGVYVSEETGRAVLWYTLQGDRFVLTGRIGEEWAANGPNGLAVDADRSVYVADTGNSQIRKVRRGGVISTIGSGFGTPFGIALQGSSLYVADPAHDAIFKVSL